MTEWLFQWNPKSYRVNDFLSRPGILSTDFLTSINQVSCEREIQIGERVYVWRSLGTGRDPGGVVARGVTSGPVRVAQDPMPEYWRDARRAGSQPRVSVRLSSVRLTPESGMITRAQALGDPTLNRMFVLRITQRTNYKLSNDEARRLAQLWEQPPPNRQRPPW